MAAAVDEAIAAADAVLLSGGTSKGAGDIAYRTIARFKDPGIVVHGVALKPGKPLCLAVTQGKPVVILPGFPTSATFTFHEFVAPVLRILSGLPALRRETKAATLPVKMVSELGRTEYVLVSLAERPEGGLAAYPIGKGSGAVTAFSLADGFFAIPAQTEMVPSGTNISVTVIGAAAEPTDLMIIGSHCVGLDYLIGLLAREGVTAKVLAAGSMAGLMAAKRGECDIAGIHLMDPATGVYNRPYLDETLHLVRGYGRLQGFVYRAGDRRFEGRDAAGAIAVASADAACLMVNRNAGSGTRILVDRLLGEARPAGYSHQTRSHNAVAAAIAQERADWGVAIETVARRYGLGFLPLQAEEYDFVVPLERRERPAIGRFIALLDNTGVRTELARMGFARI
jgi:putative molybdopterin biosynthesis protein